MMHLTCLSLGAQSGEVGCTSCRGNVRYKTYQCGKGKGDCSPGAMLPGVTNCRTCKDREPLTPMRVVRVPLKHVSDYEGFGNPSLALFNGRLVLAARHKWTGSDLAVMRLEGSDYFPRRLRYLDLRYKHYLARGGREDPRLFTFNGQLHVGYAGHSGHPNNDGVHQLFAKIDPDSGVVGQIVSPEYSGRQSWEKNWGWFEVDGRLFAVYSITPHVVLEVRGLQAVEVSRSEVAMPWSYGKLLRGGASPVRVGEEYYSFFHSKMFNRGDNGYYAMGVYTFDAVTFLPKRFCPFPLLLPEADAGNRPVVFPGGAVLKDSKWIIAYGYADRECRIAEFDASQIERALKPLPQSPTMIRSRTAGLPDAAPRRPAPVQPKRLTTLDLPGGPDGFMNGSIAEHDGKLYMAARRKEHGSEVWLAELEWETYNPLSLNRLKLEHTRCDKGQEDPRLLSYDNWLTVLFTGISQFPVSESRQNVHQLIARVNGPARALVYPRRQTWEKCWAPFAYHGRLLCVYSVAPHVILDITKDDVVDVGHTDNPAKWDYGHMRGGAPPVLHNGEYYHWFHGKIDESAGRGFYYTAGLITFAAEPPFQVKRFCKEPLLRPSDDQERKVMYPTGCILKDGRWIVSCGTEQKIVVAEFDVEEVERVLEGV